MPRTLDLVIFVLTDKTDCFTPCCACARGVIIILSSFSSLLRIQSSFQQLPAEWSKYAFAGQTADQRVLTEEARSFLLRPRQLHFDEEITDHGHCHLYKPHVSATVSSLY